MAIYGETPYVVHTAETDYKRLFYSRPEQALIKDVTLSPGYGVLKAGTVLALNKSAAGNFNKYLPYNKTVPSSADPYQQGRAFLVADAGTSTLVYVTQNDSYKFVVGDDLIIDDDDTAAENLGAITSINRTTYLHMAVINFTSSISGDFDVTNNAWVGVEAGDSSNLYSDAVGILIASVDTGTGENAKGAVGPMLISNAILYYGLIFNSDAAALVDLSASADVKFIYLK